MGIELCPNSLGDLVLYLQKKAYPQPLPKGREQGGELEYQVIYVNYGISF